MKVSIVRFGLVILLAGCGGAPNPPAAVPAPAAAPATPDLAAIFTSTGKPLAGFVLTSNTFAEGGRIADAQVYNSFGCTGGNQSPDLSWSGAPEGTKSFAILMYDPDAPTGSGFWHWLVYNIPAESTALAPGAGDTAGTALPAGTVQGRTDFGSLGYGGPCPPPGSGDHRYYFRVHALKVDKLELPEGATAALLGFNVNANTLATAQLVGIYSR
jgi:Raf kinase inhibitor-like YbhB/YbcL family protein